MGCGANTNSSFAKHGLSAKNAPVGATSYVRAIGTAVGVCENSYHYLRQAGVCTAESKACKLLHERYCIHLFELQHSRGTGLAHSGKNSEKRWIASASYFRTLIPTRCSLLELPSCKA